MLQMPEPMAWALAVRAGIGVAAISARYRGTLTGATSTTR